MARSFSKIVLRAAIETVQAAGFEIHAIEFPPDGGFKLVLMAEGAVEQSNEWDVALGLQRP